MPSDERERQFERALQRHMREKSANAACPDAETLAAYHERTLSLEELAKWKEHIGGCVRCQETLALVEGTNAIAAHDWEEQERARGTGVFGNVANLPRVSLVLRDETFDQAGEALPTAPMTAGPMVAEPKKVVGRSSWKWMAPVGALAAGLLLFVAVREHKVASPVSTVEVAQNREATAPIEKQSEKPQTPRQEDSAVPRRDSPKLAGKMESAPKLAPPAVSSQAPRQDYGTAASASKTPNEMKDEAGASTRFEAKPAAPEDVRAQGQISAELDAATRAKADLATPAPVPVGRVAGGVAPSGVSGEKKESEVRADKAKAAETTTETVMNQANRPAAHTMQYSTNASALRKIAATDPRMILAPDGNHAWRLGTTGMIEATADGGRSWKMQTSGVLNELRSGSSPSENVCWIVGKVGTILLTIDGGKHWVQVTSPLQEDLGGVHAVDARHASIWNVSNNKSFETADGGVTWTPAANE